MAFKSIAKIFSKLKEKKNPILMKDKFQKLIIKHGDTAPIMMFAPKRTHKLMSYYSKRAKKINTNYAKGVAKSILSLLESTNALNQLKDNFDSENNAHATQANELLSRIKRDAIYLESIKKLIEEDINVKGVDTANFERINKEWEQNLKTIASALEYAKFANKQFGSMSKIDMLDEKIIEIEESNNKVDKDENNSPISDEVIISMSDEESIPMSDEVSIPISDEVIISMSDEESMPMSDEKCKEDESQINIPILHNINYLQYLGAGAFGQVHLIELSSDQIPPQFSKDSNIFALKTIINSNNISDKNFQAFIEEGKIGSHLLMFENAGISKSTLVQLNEHQYAILSEYAAHGDLKSFIQRCNKINDFNDQQKASRVLLYMEQILIGIRNMHGAGVIHGDIKADNILVSGDDGLTVKLADFGFSSRGCKVEDANDKFPLGTSDQRRLGYIRQEDGTFKKNVSPTKTYFTDIFAVKVLMIELIARTAGCLKANNFLAFEREAIIKKFGERFGNITNQHLITTCILETDNQGYIDALYEHLMSQLTNKPELKEILTNFSWFFKMPKYDLAYESDEVFAWNEAIKFQNETIIKFHELNERMLPFLNSANIASNDSQYKIA